MMRRYLVPTVTILIILVGLMWWWSYSRSGTIVLSTNKPGDYVTLTKFEENPDPKKPAFNQQKQGKLSAKVKTGTYIASAQGRVTSISKIIELKSHKTVNLSLNPPQATAPEPVIGLGGQNLAADDNQLKFIISDNILAQIDGSNNLNQNYLSVHLQSIKWADPNYGVGQSDSGQLYIVNSASASLLRLSGVKSNYNALDYAISPNRRIYMLVGRDLYSGFNSADMKKIYTASPELTRVEASNDMAALFSIQTDTNEISAKKPPKPLLEVVSSAGKNVKKKAIAASQIAWSADGQKLAAINFKGYSQIYDSKLNAVGILPSLNVSNVGWINNTALLYSVGENLWTYNLGSEQATVLADLTPGNTIGEIAVDKSQRFAYLSVQTEESSEIMRVGLQGQKAPDFVYQLDIFLPANLPNCLVNYVNFTQITILAQSSGDSRACQQAAQNEVTQDGFDLSKLKIQVKPQ